MSPVDQLRGWRRKGFPRVSGDEPGNAVMRINAAKFSPRERG